MRAGARIARPLCGERCGVRLAKVWGKKFNPFWRARHAANNQGNRERETEREKVQIADSGGLCLVVQPWGGKFWLWRYRFDGTEKNMTFGDYPHVGPTDARNLHFAAKKLLAAGTNPMSKRKAEAEAKQHEAKALQREADSSFEKVARKWWAWWSVGKSPRRAETLMNRLEADVFLVIGHLPIDAVLTTHLRDILLAIEMRGASDVAKRAHQSIGQIFRFAIPRGLASRNPAAAHTHPAEAFQSSSDKANPMVAQAGHIAIIIPNFARSPVQPRHLRIYEYCGQHEWTDRSPSLAPDYFYTGMWS